MSALMDQFSKDTLRFGSLQGFKHFRLHLRGREELLVIIRRNSPGGGGKSPGFDNDGSDDDDDNPIPFRRRRMNSVPDGLPPASPSTRETQTGGPNDIVFLVGGYARYKCPYVWVRSEHKEMAGLDKELPLKLNTTEKWKHENAKVWDITAELVQLNLLPNPPNPFEIDHAHFDSLEPFDRTVAHGAMVNFLREVYNSEASYADLVFHDLQTLLHNHFEELPAILNMHDSEEEEEDEIGD